MNQAVLDRNNDVYDIPLEKVLDKLELNTTDLKDILMMIDQVEDED